MDVATNDAFWRVWGGDNLTFAVVSLQRNASFEALIGSSVAVNAAEQDKLLRATLIAGTRKAEAKTLSHSTMVDIQWDAARAARRRAFAFHRVTANQADYPYVVRLRLYEMFR